MVDGHHLCCNARRLVVCRCDHRPVFPQGDRLCDGGSFTGCSSQIHVRNRHKSNRCKDLRKISRQKVCSLIFFEKSLDFPIILLTSVNLQAIMHPLVCFHANFANPADFALVILAISDKIRVSDYPLGLPSLSIGFQSILDRVGSHPARTRKHGPTGATGVGVQWSGSLGAKSARKRRPRSSPMGKRSLFILSNRKQHPSSSFPDEGTRK